VLLDELRIWWWLFVGWEGWVLSSKIVRVNDDIRRILGVACITDKVREARLRWYGHVQRREENDCVKRILEANVGGQRSRGRQRKRWINVVKHYMDDLQLNVEDAENRAEWRRRTRVADSLPERATAWRREFCWMIGWEPCWQWLPSPKPVSTLWRQKELCPDIKQSGWTDAVICFSLLPTLPWIGYSMETVFIYACMWVMWKLVQFHTVSILIIVLTIRLAERLSLYCLVIQCCTVIYGMQYVICIDPSSSVMKVVSKCTGILSLMLCFLLILTFYFWTSYC